LPSSPNSKDVEYFRNRAEEARSLAEEMKDAHTKSLMLGIAESYEQVAKSYEKAANWETRHREPE
jgi:DNA-binding ferritin-like protein